MRSAPVTQCFRVPRQLLLMLALALTTASLGTAEAATWASCGAEGGSCSIPSRARAVVRYGNDTKGYFYWGVQGIDNSPCNNFQGDPAKTLSKSCAYATDISMLPTAYNTHCANEYGTCDVGPTPRWGRYGLDGRWFETIQTGIISCTNGFFNYDPFPGRNKVCQIAEPVELTGNWTTCASEYSTCYTSGMDPKTYGVLLRYGLGSRWTYRITTVSDIHCTNDRFNKDPYDTVNKQCDYIPLASKGTSFGQWISVGYCDNCTSVKQTLTLGTNFSTTQTNQSQWSSTVKASVARDFTIYGATYKVSAEVSYAYSQSQTLSTALSNSITRSTEMMCATPAGTPQNIRMYQFMTNTRADCLHTGTCAADSYTVDIRCVYNPPFGYTGPKCVPGYCADTLRTTCYN
jgi:hypothetical protein